MANVRVAMSKKGTLIALAVLVLFLGGGGAYLLWRVNQKDTVAPTDSDASESHLECIDDSDCTKRTYLKEDGNCKDENTAGLCQYPNQNYCCRYKKVYTKYHITYTAEPNGSVSNAGQNSVTPGGSISSTATPNSGYKFKQWSDGKTTATRTDSNVQADATYTATFELIPTETFTLTYIAGTGGTITGTTPQTVNKGSDGTKVTAVPNAGYEFVKWSDGLQCFLPEGCPNQGERQDKNVQASATYTATFKSTAPNTVTLTYVAGSGGKITGVTPQTLAVGAKGSEVTAVPDAGYTFRRWCLKKGKGEYICGDVVGGTPNPKRTDIAPSENTTYTAEFSVADIPDPVNCTGFTISCGTNNTINVKWNSLSGSVKYVVRANKSPFDDWANTDEGDQYFSLANNLTSYVVPNIVPNTLYYVNVMAYSGTDEQKDFHPSCKMTGLGDIWSATITKQLTCSDSGIPIPGGGSSTPQTGIFDNTKHTVIFGIVVLMVGIAWTWVSTLPKRAYTTISKASSEYISNARTNKERNIRESRRNRLEKRIK